MSTITTQLENLTAATHLRTVIDFLIDQPEIRNNRRASRQFMIFNIRLRGIEDDEMNNSREQRLIDIAKNEAGGDLLNILNRHRRVIDTIAAAVPEAPARKIVNSGNGDPTASTTILFLTSDPTGVGTTMVDTEKARILSAITENQDNQLQFLPKDNIRKETLNGIIFNAKPMVVHFSVHGVAASAWSREGIVLQDTRQNTEVASTEYLENLFGTLQQQLAIKLVFLNACLSENQARMISAHVPYVVGMTHEIENGTAISFAKGFYRGLSQNPEDVPYAFSSGLLQLEEDELPGADLPRLFVEGVEQMNLPD